ncbi:hypothetical protein N9A94_05750 [Akkermansiaceae bacterium]|jgi:hypothetical protein|nr:hypothetical protein [Akkermansiaceae bacterium]
MKQLTKFTALFITFALSSCNKDEHPHGDDVGTTKVQTGSAKQEEIADKILNSMQEFSTAIAAVSDAKSAKTAAAKINEIGDRYSGYAEELMPLDPPAREVRESLHRKMKEKEAAMGTVMKGDFLTIIQGLTPDAQKVIQMAFQDFYDKRKAVEAELNRHFKVEG